MPMKLVPVSTMAIQSDVAHRVRLCRSSDTAKEGGVALLFKEAAWAAACRFLMGPRMEEREGGGWEGGVTTRSWLEEDGSASLEDSALVSSVSGVEATVTTGGGCAISICGEGEGEGKGEKREEEGGRSERGNRRSEGCT
jgi:hypothetical protein